MAKLKLDVNSLSVQSFQTVATEGAARGTVHGRAEVPDKTYGCSINPPCLHTEQLSCNGTCYETCHESCHWELTCHTCLATCPITCWNTCGNTCGSCMVATCGATCPQCAEPTLPTET